MNHFAGKILRAVLVSASLTTLLTVSALAAEVTAVGATTGSSLRLRAEPSTSSSVVTMLNKSEAVAILETMDGWYKVAFDGNTGFVSADFLIVDQDGVFESGGKCNSDDVSVRAAASKDADVLFSMKSNVSVTVNGFENGWYEITSNDVTGYVPSGYLNLTSGSGTQSSSGIVETAMAHLGTRYVYGGSAPGGFDCSGFTSYVFRQFGYSLPHSATSQWLSSAGTKVWSISALEPGDLVFFCDPSRSLGKACSHAGVYIGGGQFVHSSSSRSGGVIVSSLTSGYYNDYFVGGKRM